MATVTLASGLMVESADLLYDFVRDEVTKGTDWTADEVFTILGQLLVEFEPNNRGLLAKRAEYQRKIDEYYIAKRRSGWQPNQESADQDAVEFERFLANIGYFAPEKPVDFKMTTPQLDLEMDLNGPELVTPVTIASMAVGGANARWGSLYDAYFLSDMHPEIDRETQRSQRLRMVLEETNSFLDQHVAQWEYNVSFGVIASYSVRTNTEERYELVGHTSDGKDVRLLDPSKFVGFNQDEQQGLCEFFLEDNGLEIQFQLYDGGTVHGETGQFRDLIVESAVTTIVDFEDAVAIVDAEDMVLALRNFLGLVKGDLQASSSRGNLKKINSDKTYVDVNGNQQTLKGTSLMSVRNVSLHVYTDMVTVAGQEIPERILGVFLTTLIAHSHDKGSNGEEKKGRRGMGSA